MGPVEARGGEATGRRARRGSFRLVVNRLYYDASEPVSSGFAFDEEILLQALRNIYRRKINPKSDIEPVLFKEIRQIIRKAVRNGISQSSTQLTDHDTFFIHQLLHSADVFAAFKVHRLQNDMAARLLDSNGNLKSFEKWLKDVQPIASHQCSSWFQTEYSTAVIRAHQAADWKQFERERDVLPNLKWMPSTSANPGADHRLFWGTIRPIDDKFWKEHRPGDRWNCKCSLSSTDEAVTPLPDDIPVSSQPQPGLTGNPGQDGMIFSEDHPYITGAYPGAHEAVNKTVMPLFKKEIITETDVMDFINSSPKAKEWFQRGFTKLDTNVSKGNNGQTDLKGHISLKDDIMKKVKSAMEKIRVGEDLNIDEERAMATLWHEITHNRSRKGIVTSSPDSKKRKTMELANEFVARKSLPEFYEGLGAEMKYPEFMKTRSNTSYNPWVLNFEDVIKRTGCDYNEVFVNVRKSLFNESLDDQWTFLAKALEKGGAKKADGTKLKDGELRKLIGACLQKGATYENNVKTIIGD